MLTFYFMCEYYEGVSCLIKYITIVIENIW